MSDGPDPVVGAKKPGFFSRIGNGVLKVVDYGLDMCVPPSPALSWSMCRAALPSRHTTSAPGYQRPSDVTEQRGSGSPLTTASRLSPSR